MFGELELVVVRAKMEFLQKEKKKKVEGQRYFNPASGRFDWPQIKPHFRVHKTKLDFVLLNFPAGECNFPS